MSWLAEGFSHLFGGPSKPQQAPPNALSSAPTQADASRAAQQKQLDQEHNSAYTSTVLTGGQGLTDQPTTTSSVLIGN